MSGGARRWTYCPVGQTVFTSVKEASCRIFAGTEADAGRAVLDAAGLDHSRVVEVVDIADPGPAQRVRNLAPGPEDLPRAA